ncbi:DTW domain-containing protein [Spongiibacter sp. KMU-158]|uniref:tRNA-uridine aminocarboxypropyltransferase n=1 Tax=Spongiibacter pelagi TaxID=2760804 RepID=A0A927GWS8_9GAMM|nr:tRNA-uridine aminocarboxypropyltransferase [Spongiibacter pelagi]MBD2859428.1 DTW domain-containing protein [Spongiibacter pelagi]
MSSRPTCSECLRPATTCLCGAIVQRRSAYQLIILQHPKEARHALSTAPLLARSIIGSQLLVGETFDPCEILGADWQQTSVLLYPGERVIEAEKAQTLALKNLIVLDGTWRKTAKLIHMNPWLTQLPCLALQPATPSRYRIRKSPRADGLSTIEATAQALNALHNSEDFDAILGVFDKMIEHQISAMGEETFKRNYESKWR